MSLDNEFAAPETQPDAPLQDKVRCRFTNARGVRCPHRILEHYSGLCLLHKRFFDQQDMERARDLTAQLFDQLDSIDTRDELRGFLLRLMRFVSEQKLDRQDGAMLVYASSLLLQTLASRHVSKEEQKPPVKFIWDVLRYPRETDASANAADSSDQGDAEEDVGDSTQ